MKEIGILGGTFDPIHIGHTKLGIEAIKQFDLSEIWIIPAFNPPHKTLKNVTSYEDRVNMIRLAIENLSQFKILEIEKMRGGKSYTSETLKELVSLYPKTRFSFIIGADSLYEIEDWHKPEEVMKFARLLVALRTYDKAYKSLVEQVDYLKEKYNADIEIISYNKINISSNEIRSLVSQNKDYSALVEEQVKKYIESNKLYKGD
jgi:nicotinate-nucleotide adenylyltransferase